MGLEFSELSDYELTCEIDKCEQCLNYAELDDDSLSSTQDRLESLKEELSMRDQDRSLV